ncbi:MAG TPA: VOC family protein [Actinomycetota bacterium]|nr:VOC family protein [Actinomycetota bacterium]
MSIQSLGYSIIIVDDFPLMKQWYEQSLGLALQDYDEEGKWATFGFPDGGAELAIHGLPEGHRPPPTQAEAADQKGGGRSKVVPCLEVADINVAVEELKGKGVKFVREVHGTHVLLANFTDPEGNMLQIFQKAAGV